MQRASLFALPLVFLAGCYLSHPAPPRSDASVDAPRRDAPLDAPRPRGSYWTLERRPARLSIPHELGCTQIEGGRVAVEARVLLSSSCEHQGPVTYAEAPDGTFVVSAFVWVEMGTGCELVVGEAETTLLLPAREGAMRVVEELGGTSVEHEARAIDDLPCTRDGGPGSPCRLDCECAGEMVCIPEVGDAVECFGGICGTPCVPAATMEPLYALHLECAEDEHCVAVGAAASCRPATSGCDAGCGPGLSCAAERGRCRWDLTLSAAVRHPCETDGDCDRGLFCVEADGRRTCEVPCATAHMACPSMHECRPERWVCEWLGE